MTTGNTLPRDEKKRGTDGGVAGGTGTFFHGSRRIERMPELESECPNVYMGIRDTERGRVPRENQPKSADAWQSDAAFVGAACLLDEIIYFGDGV